MNIIFQFLFNSMIVMSTRLYFSVSESADNGSDLVPAGRLDGAGYGDQGIFPLDADQLAVTVSHHGRHQTLTFQSIAGKTTFIRQPLFVDVLFNKQRQLNKNP